MRNLIAHLENSHLSLRVNSASCRWLRSYASITFWLVHPVNEDLIHLTEGLLQALKYLGPGTLEDLCKGADTKWESDETKTSKWFHKGCEQFWLGIEGNLPKTTVGVKFLEYLTISQFSDVLIQWRYWVYLTLGCFVKLSQVNTDTHTVIWFTARDDTCTPFSWRCYRRDHFLLKHCFSLESVDGESFLYVGNSALISVGP